MTNDNKRYDADFCVETDDDTEESIREIQAAVEDIGSETGYVRVSIEETTEKQVKANRALFEAVSGRDSDQET